MTSIKETQSDWDKHFQGYTVAEQVRLTELEETLPLFYKYLRKDQLIVDMGCGLGKHLIYWHDRGYRIAGVDLNMRCVEKIKAYGSFYDVAQGDVLNLPYEDGQVSFAISFGVIEHFEDGPGDALKEMHRVLKERGIAFISVPLDSLAKRLLEKVKRNKFLRRLFRKTPIGDKACLAKKKIVELSFTRKEFETLLSSAGFTILETQFELTKWSLCSLFHFVRSKDFPEKPTYAHVLRPPMSLVGKILHSLITFVNPWLIAGFQFYVAKKN